MNNELVGQQIDQYRIDALLGAGGMGKVYQAYDLNLARKVATQLILKAIAKEPDGRFQTGQEMANALRQTAVTLSQSGHTILQTLAPAVTELQPDQPLSAFISSQFDRAHL